MSYGKVANAKMVCTNVLIKNNVSLYKPILWLSGGFYGYKVNENITEIQGYDLKSNNVIKTNCHIPERQCHIMCHLNLNYILVGFGWHGKKSLNDMYIFDYGNFTLNEIKIDELKPDNGMD